MQSLVDGFFEGPGADPEYRAALRRRLGSGGVGELMAELEKVDPESARRIDPTKPRRIIRALEVFHATGAPLSDTPPPGPAGDPVRTGAGRADDGAQRAVCADQRAM